MEEFSFCRPLILPFCGEESDRYFSRNVKFVVVVGAFNPHNSNLQSLLSEHSLIISSSSTDLGTLLFVFLDFLGVGGF
jgi:hypothetical protein